MAEIHWIKLKTTMFDDEKIRLIESMPEADAIINIWIRLLILAGKTNDSGLIYIQRNMPYSAEMLSTLFNRKINVIKLALTTLAKFDMINVNDDGLIEIANWEKHQNIEGMEKVRKLTAERNRKYRERLKSKQIESDVSVTSRDATDSDSDSESDKNKTYSPAKAEQHLPYEKIIDYLNEKAGTSYRSTTKKTQTLIKARFNEKFSLDDFKKVIDKKVAEWKNDTAMNKFLRPETLFGTKFESYLNQNVKQNHTPTGKEWF